MKQRLHKMLSILLSVALIASTCVGALSVSFDFVSADAPSGYSGNFDELVAAARLDCPTSNLSTFDSYTEYMYDVFDDTLIVVIHEENTQNWFFGCYSAQNPDQYDFWYASNDYNKIYIKRTGQITSTLVKVEYSFKFNGSTFYKNNSYSYSVDWLQGASINFTGTTYSYGPGKGIYDQSGMKVYFNRDIKWVSNRQYYDYLSPNLLKTSPIPDPIEFHWFKFQLGQRWYVTTYDQSLIANLETGDDTYWVWFIQEFPFDFLETEEYHRLYIYWRDIQVLPGAQYFISQSLTNLSASGVLAYDITDLILNGEFEFLGQSKFYQILDGPSGPSVGNLMAQSSDYIDLELTPDEENESQNNAWEEISDYTENYPSVTISPQELAEQVLGSRAYTGSIGVIQIPSGIYDWCVQHKPNFIVAGDTSADGYWHYKLDSSGILSTNLTMINWDLCNACLIPAPDPSWISDELGIDSYSFPVYWWNPSDQVLTDAFYLGTFTVEMILQQFDIVIFAPSDAPYLSNFDGIFSFPGSIGFTNLELDSQIGAVNGATRHQVFICSTDKVLLKSQLYAFCDSSSKLYDLLSQYIAKRDLWDESFFKWSLSVFWELETVNGHLNAIQSEVLSWHLVDKFNALISKADQIIQNTAPVDEENVDPWYLSLWNFILQFKPSNSQISTGIDYIDQNLDDIPLLPYLTPVPALPTPGGG